MFNGKKAVKKILAAVGLSQREYCIKEGLTENIISVRFGRNYYNKPANLARFADSLGLVLQVEVSAVIKDQEGNVICDVPIDGNFMNEE